MISELLGGDPELVGPYRLIGRLGAGGMGRVYLGKSPGGHLAAVKVIRAELADDPDFRARFAQEVAAARTVSGMFTAAVVDADARAATPWLATAYVAGPSLADAVQMYGPLPPSSVLSLTAGLAEGLTAVHAAGVVHRDLKPANVLLAQDGPRLIDFGISRAAEASSLTRSGVVVGSPGFMSPEQAEGREVGSPTDIFSLGAVVVFAATGLSPFGSGPTPALVYRVVHDEADLSGLDERIRQLARRCLAKDPAERPSAEEVMVSAGTAQPATDWLPAGIVSALPRYKPEGLAVAVDSHDPTELPRPGAASPAAGQPDAFSTVTAAARQPGLPSPQPVRPPHRKRHQAWAWAGLPLAVVAAAAVIFASRHGGSTATEQSARTAGSTVSPQSSPATGSAPVSPGPSSSSPGTPRTVVQPSASSSPVTSPSTAQTSTPPTAAAPPPTPGSVQASASGQYAMTVTWSDNLADVSGFRVDNGCETGCGAGALLAKTTGAVTSTQFTVTPGTYQCFRVQAFNASGSSNWSGYGCASTPGLTVPGAQEWTDSGVTVASGDELGITANGQVYIDPNYPVGPDGDPSCTPSSNYPNAEFPAPNLPCWSLIARIGSGVPFEVGTSAIVTTASGTLYLGVNDNNFADNSGNWTVNIKIGGLPPPP